MPRVVAIFPGQGSQKIGMGADVAARFTSAADVFRRADALLDKLNIPLSELCFRGPAERLNATDIQQPAIFTTSVALLRAAEEAGLADGGTFTATGGLSLGEYTALHLAGSLTFDDALRLVQRRGELMQQACVRHPGSMVALLGMDAENVEKLCAAVASHGRVAPANFNCPGQIVISGDAPACQAAAAAAEQFGGRATPLPVAGAFHSHLMRSAADEFRAALEAVEIRPPRIPVIANVDASYHSTAASIRESLLRQIYSPVRWQGCVERLIADGGEEFWELGPGRALTGFMRKINRGVKAAAFGTVEELQPAVRVSTGG